MVFSIFARFPILVSLGLSGGLLISGCAKTNGDEASQSPLTAQSVETVSAGIFSPDIHDWPHDISDVAPDPRVEYGRLDNGMRYAILPVADIHGTISVQLNMDVGYNHEAEGLYGIAHLLEHIAFRGKRGEKDGSVIHELQAGGVGYGNDLNGYTQADNTYYRINLSAAGKTTVNDALKSLKTLIDLSGLNQENMEAEKRIVLAELKVRDTVERRAARSYRAFERPNNPRETVEGIGTEDSLDAITLKDLEDFKAEHYLPKHALLVIVGDVDLKRSKRDIAKIFSEWPAAESNAARRDSSTQGPISKVEDVVSFRDPKARTQLNALQHRPRAWQGDSFEARKRTIVQRLVNSVVESRIDQRVEAEPQVNWINLTRKSTKAHDLIGVRLAARDFPVAMTIFEEERRKAVEFGFTQEELDYAIAKKRAPFDRRDTSADTIQAWSEANNIRSRFTGGNVYNASSQELAIIDEISAGLNLEDFNLAARDMWSDFEPKYWSQSKADMTGKIANVKAARLDVAERVLSAPVAVTDTSFQFVEFDEIGKIKSRDVERSGKTQRLLFENGVRLNYKVRDDEPDNILITLNLRDPGSEMVETNYAAISEKVLQISRADIKGADAYHMDRQFVGTQTDFGLYLFEDRLVLYLSTTPESLQDGLDLMSSFLVSFDPESKDFKKKFKERIKAVKNSGRRSPVTEGLLEIRFAYSGQSAPQRSMFANSYVINSLINADIDRIIKKGTIEVGVVGDFDAQALETAFASSVGAVPRRPGVTTEPVQTNESVTLIEPGLSTLTYAGSADQMALFYCHPESVSAFEPRFSQANLLSKIAQNRLRENLRVELGISYSPQVYRHANNVFPNLGFVCLYAQFDPVNERPAHDSFRSVISSLQDTPITKAELERAREPLLSQVDRYGEASAIDVHFVSRAYSNPGLSIKQDSDVKALKAVKLKSLKARARELYDLSNYHVFRVQHFQGGRAIKKTALEIESYLGFTDSQLAVGKHLLGSSDKGEVEKGIETLNQAGAQGSKEAYLELGKFHASEFSNYTLKRRDLKAAATAFELAGPSAESAYRLSSIYFHNFDVFPDVKDETIIELAREGAEGGLAEGQYYLAERLKDGTLVERDEIGALKWALISNHTKRGVLAIDDEKGIARFVTGLPEADIQAAQAQAEDWVAKTKG